MSGLSFRVDRNLSVGLVEQVVDGFRQAILNGFYKPGDTLPTIRALAPQLGVSVRVTAEAVKTLTAEGYVAPRPRIGSVVLGRNETLWRGHVVVVLPEGDYGYYQNNLIGRVRSRLFKAGYLCTQVTVPLIGRKRYDMSVLDIVLNRPVNLVVALFDCPAVLKTLALSSVPYITVAVDRRGARNCVGSILQHSGSAVSKFVAQCAASGVRRVLQIGKASDEKGVVPALDAAGIETRRRWIDGKRRSGRIEDLQRSTIDLFKLLARDGTLKWPDLVYCTDDYLAMAAMLALAHLGVRIPEDVRFASVSNKGHGPVAWDTLARIEHDANSHGDIIASGVLSHLEGKGFPPDLRLEAEYHAGASFPG